MGAVELVWDIAKTLWDILKTIGPFAAKRYRLRRGIWQRLVRIGAKSAGTPADEVEALIDAFANPTFFVAESRHPILRDIRRSIWAAHQRLDELRLLALAERSSDDEERRWSINQIGQRSGSYAIPTLQAIANSLSTSDSVKAAARRAIESIEMKKERTEPSNKGMESDE